MNPMLAEATSAHARAFQQSFGLSQSSNNVTDKDLIDIRARVEALEEHGQMLQDKLDQVLEEVRRLKNLVEGHDEAMKVP